MFCKHCGDRIDKKGNCVSCGKPAGPLEGGVGFWDLAVKGSGGGILPPATNIVNVEHLISEGTDRLDRGMNHIYRRQAQTSKLQTALLAVIAVLLTVGIALDICLLETVRDIRDAAQGTVMEESMQPTETAVPVETGAETEATVPVESVEREGETLTEPLPADGESISKDIVIEKDPTPETVDQNSEGKLLFVTKVHTNGHELQFKWQKKDESDGQWKSIDEAGLEEYLYQEDDKENTTEGIYSSKLHLTKYGEDILGEYRCEITVVGAESYPLFTEEADLKLKESQVW